MSDTTSIDGLYSLGERILKVALKTSPSEGNGYGLALGVLVLVAIYMGINAYLERRDAKRYRERQEERQDKQDADLLKRATDEQASREAARERVIEEQRKNAEYLRGEFGKLLAPLESRVGALEHEQRESREAIILLKAKSGFSDNGTPK